MCFDEAMSRVPLDIAAAIQRRMRTVAPPVFWTDQQIREHRDFSESIRAELNPKSFWRQILCSHYSVFHGGLPEDASEYMSGRFLKFVCRHCGRMKKFRDHPINRLEPNA